MSKTSQIVVSIFIVIISLHLLDETKNQIMQFAYFACSMFGGAGIGMSLSSRDRISGNEDRSSSI